VTKTDAMFIHVFVRRAEVGCTAPFTWEIRGAGATPIEMSVERFKTMHTAYEAGQAQLAKLMRPASTLRSGGLRVKQAQNDARAINTPA
jgi:hypothetical protein